MKTNTQIIYLLNVEDYLKQQFISRYRYRYRIQNAYALNIDCNGILQTFDGVKIRYKYGVSKDLARQMLALIVLSTAFGVSFFSHNLYSRKANTYYMLCLVISQTSIAAYFIIRMNAERYGERSKDVRVCMWIKATSCWIAYCWSHDATWFSLCRGSRFWCFYRWFRSKLTCVRVFFPRKTADIERSEVLAVDANVLMIVVIDEGFFRPLCMSYKDIAWTRHGSDGQRCFIVYPKIAETTLHLSIIYIELIYRNSVSIYRMLSLTFLYRHHLT